METASLGATGMQVSRLCLGAMMFGAWGNPDHADCARIIHAALDAGVNFIDTADIYSSGESEEIVGKALAGRRDRVILATKVFHPAGNDPHDPNQRGLSRRWIRMEVENSLRRLGTDWIDLYQVHRPDYSVDIDETLGVLSDLVREGKVRAIGTSTFPAHELVEAQWTSERRCRERFLCEQPPYSILMRGIESAVLPVARKYGMGVICWSPLGGGWLSGKVRPGNVSESWRASRAPKRFDEKDPVNRRKFEAVEQVAALAKESGIPLVELAVAFTLHHPAVSSTIIGPRTMEQLTTQLGAADRRLDAATLDRIDEIVPPGTDLGGGDETYYVSPALADVKQRRRHFLGMA